jgi:hypothetical protein
LREIFLTDRKSRLESILTDSMGTETLTDVPVGIGFFRCIRSESVTASETQDSHDRTPAQRGVHFDAYPNHLRNLLLTQILAGQHSPLSQEIVLFGTEGQAPSTKSTSNTLPKRLNDQSVESSKSDLLRRWLVAGLQPLADLAEQNVPLTAMNETLMRCQSLRAAVDTILSEIMHKAAEISAPCVVFPIDAPILVEFFYSTLGPVPFGLGKGHVGNAQIEGVVPQTYNLLRQSVVDECVAWFAANPLEFQVIMLCEDNLHMQRLVTSCRLIKSSGASPRVNFKL